MELNKKNQILEFFVLRLLGHPVFYTTRTNILPVIRPNKHYIVQFKSLNIVHQLFGKINELNLTMVFSQQTNKSIVTYAYIYNVEHFPKKSAFKNMTTLYDSL